MAKFIPIIVAIVAALFFLQVMLRGMAAKKVDASVYYLRKALFSPAERSFLGVLEGQLPPGIRVFGKVRLEDIFGVKAGLERGARQAARNRINRKHVDFLLVRASDLVPVAGIELDDSSHEEEDRQERDTFVDAAFAGASLPLLHFPAQKAYSFAEIRSRLAELHTA